MKFVFAILVILAVGLVGLLLLRATDRRADQQERGRLLALQPIDPKRFSLTMVADLPEPVRRYFGFAIAEGTPLFTVAQIEMTGKFSLGTKDAPNYMKMTATQVLAAPDGFVWQMAGGSGLMRISGSDSGLWTRFWLAGLAPVARFGATDDFRRSAFARYAGEAAFWTPAALLPGPNVTWEAVDQNTARYTMRRDGLSQTVDIIVDAEGRPIRGEFLRWTNANADGIFRLQPFGAYLSDFREVEGFRVPFHVEAGNMFGTDDYFAFFIADVSAIRFPVREGQGQ